MSARPGPIFIGGPDRCGKTLLAGLLGSHSRISIPVVGSNLWPLFYRQHGDLRDLDNARRFLRLPPSHVTYLACRCRRGADVNRVAAELRRAIPEHDVLTHQQFHDKSLSYWRGRTGIGSLLLLCSGLAVTVGFLIVLVAFYVSTVEKIPIFACMKERQIGAILAAMNKDRAVALTKALAGDPSAAR